MNRFLKQLIEEVESTPLDIDVLNLKEVSDDDEVIGQLTDDFTKRLMIVRNKVGDKGNELMSSDTPPTKDIIIEFLKIEKKCDVLSKLFWVAVRDEVPDAWKHDNIAVKKDWQIVAVKEDPSRCALGGAVGVIIARH